MKATCDDGSMPKGSRFNDSYMMVDDVFIIIIGIFNETKDLKSMIIAVIK